MWLEIIRQKEKNHWEQETENQTRRDKQER